jgi:hypothetical protein
VPDNTRHDGLTYMGRVVVSLKLSMVQYSTLFQERYLRNAVYSTCIVSLAQQLCGGKLKVPDLKSLLIQVPVNVFAFYSNKIFSGADDNLKVTLAYSIGFGTRPNDTLRQNFILIVSCRWHKLFLWAPRHEVSLYMSRVSLT